MDRLEALVAPAAATDTVSAFSFEEFAGNVGDLRTFLGSRPDAVAGQSAAALAQLADP